MTASITDVTERAAMGRPVRVGWVTFGPVHYHSPLYRLVAADPRVDLTVIYLTRAGLLLQNGGYSGDVDLLSGYRHEFVKRANRPMTHPLRYRDLDVAWSVLRGRFDVLILHGYASPTHQLAALAQLSLRRPVVFREAQTLLTDRPRSKRILKNAWLRPLFKRCYALCVGTENERWFAQFGVPEGRRFMAPNAVDNERLKREIGLVDDDRAALRREFGLPPDGCPVFISVGRLVPQKGPLQLLSAFAKLRSKTRCALFFVGSGPLRPAIEAECRRLGLTDVHMAGFVEQSRIVRAYLAADVFVLPSALNEPWGMVVNEAMLCGLPVIVSDRVGASSDLVHEDVNGFVVKPGDVDALEGAMASLVSAPERRRQFGAASRRFVESWNHERGAAAVVAAVARAVGPDRWLAASDTSDSRE